jgi:hypothetical protein
LSSFGANQRYVSSSPRITELAKTAELLPFANLIRMVMPSALAVGEKGENIYQQNIETANLIFRIFFLFPDL